MKEFLNTELNESASSESRRDIIPHSHVLFKKYICIPFHRKGKLILHFHKH